VDRKKPRPLKSGVMRFSKEDKMDTKEMIAKLEKEFGSRLGFLGHQILMLSMTGQKCDITFFKKEPAIDVKIDQQINLALMYKGGRCFQNVLKI